jgi:hypothetical protein
MNSIVLQVEGKRSQLIPGAVVLNPGRERKGSEGGKHS